MHVSCYNNNLSMCIQVHMPVYIHVAIEVLVKYDCVIVYNSTSRSSYTCDKLKFAKMGIRL